MVLLIVVLVGLYVVIRGRGSSFAADEMIAKAAEPGIAFMPFTVSGAGLEHLREGMVTLLFASLDGAAGMRAISDRTVLAQWDRLVGGGQRADLETAMGVAAETGARYALLGSVVAVGPRLQLSGDIYELPNRSSLARVQVEGSADSLSSLVDDLAVETLQALAEAGVETVPKSDLTGVTTRSLSALTAYLEGEAHFRRGDFVEALPHYEQALKHDSTFALAHYRAGQAVGWDGAQLPVDERGVRVRRHMSDALRFGLPSRTALYAQSQGGADYSPESVNELRELVRRHPDDAEAWYMLGEELTHGDGGVLQVVDGYEQAQRAFTRAAELDPGFAPYMLHLIDLAFKDYHAQDAARWVRAYNRASPDSPMDQAHRLVYRLIFESTEDTTGLGAAVDTLTGLGLTQRLRSLLAQPRASRVLEAVMLWESQQTRELDPRLCSEYALAEGRWQDFLGYAANERMAPSARRYCLYLAYLMGFPVSLELLVEADAAAAEDGSTQLQFLDTDLLWEGIRAASTRGWDDYAARIAVLKEHVEAARTAGDTASAERGQRYLSYLESYGAWQRGDSEKALELLAGMSYGAFNLWLRGRISLDLDRPEDALRYFKTLRGTWDRPWTRVLYYEGLAYEQMGELEKAQKTYGEYLDIWKDVDPELEPLKEQVLKRLEAIVAERG
jgi:tetratricopeptide (TPR) repeat protein